MTHCVENVNHDALQPKTYGMREQSWNRGASSAKLGDIGLVRAHGRTPWSLIRKVAERKWPFCAGLTQPAHILGHVPLRKTKNATVKLPIPSDLAQASFEPACQVTRGERVCGGAAPVSRRPLAVKEAIERPRDNPKIASRVPGARSDLLVQVDRYGFAMVCPTPRRLFQVNTYSES